MIKSFLALVLTIQIYSSMQKQRFTTSYLLPHTTNLLPPFLLDDKQYGDSQIKLRITCSKMVKNMDITANNKKLCLIEEIEGDNIEINNLLQNIEVKTKELRKTKKPLTINYDLIIYNKLSKKPKMQSIQQKFLPMVDIPIKIKKQRIERTGSEDLAFNVKIAEISKKYLYNSAMSNLELKFNQTSTNSFVDYRYVNNSVYLYGTLPSVLFEFFNFDIVIYDRQSHLYSKHIKIHVLSDVEQPKDPSLILLVYILFLAILIFFTRQLLFLCSKRVLKINKTQKGRIEEKLRRRRLKRTKSTPNLVVVWEGKQDSEKTHFKEEFEHLKKEFKKLPKLCKNKLKEIISKNKLKEIISKNNLEKEKEN